MAKKRNYSTPRYKRPRNWSNPAKQGARAGLIYGMAISSVKGHNLKTRVYVTGVTTAAGAGIGAGINKRKEYNMARGKKGSWRGGNAPAQGGTPHRMSKPEGSKGKLKKGFSKGSSRMTGRGKK